MVSANKSCLLADMQLLARTELSDVTELHLLNTCTRRTACKHWQAGVPQQQCPSPARLLCIMIAPADLISAIIDISMHALLWTAALPLASAVLEMYNALRSHCPACHCSWVVMLPPPGLPPWPTSSQTSASHLRLPCCQPMASTMALMASSKWPTLLLVLQSQK